MCNLDLKADKRAAAVVAAESDKNSARPVPRVQKRKPNPDSELHLACEGDTFEQDNLVIAAEALPLFDTHSSRHLG
jgi:hypothetical protein